MTKRRGRGLDLLVRPERTEAFLWGRLRLEQRQDAREPLFNRYRGFAQAVAVRMRPWSQPANVRDAEQWAYAGLLQAIDSFDPLRGAPFRAYAKPRILGSVRDGFARLGELEAQWAQRRRAERDRIRSLKSELAVSSDSVESLAQIAACLAIGLMLDGTGMIADEHAADPAPNAYDSLAWRQVQARLQREIERLSPAEATVIRQHYLNGLAFVQVAELMGLTRGRISQLHSAALAKLRKRISREY